VIFWWSPRPVGCRSSLNWHSFTRDSCERFREKSLSEVTADDDHHHAWRWQRWGLVGAASPAPPRIALGQVDETQVGAMARITQRPMDARTPGANNFIFCILCGGQEHARI
jgi:hypothetical protein